jgi:acyl-CoA synthetase (AMP-forming)/AMP-acid ligase II
MHLSTLVEMIDSGFDTRVVIGSGEQKMTGAQLAAGVRTAGAAIGVAGSGSVVYVGENHPLLPVAVLGAAWAGVPFVPLNYRLDDGRLAELVSRQQRPLVLADSGTASRLGPTAVVLDEWLAERTAIQVTDPAIDDDAVAVVLHTSGTTSEPKAALLRHRHLMAYLLGSVEFASAGEDEAVLVSVPPYHVAGMANLLSNLFAGRRVVYLSRFDPAEWLHVVRDEAITHAMVVPTMLARVVEHLDGRPADVPTLRSLSYGGARMPARVLRDALAAFGSTGFVNAYGLTETASTIAVLGPDDHRDALSSTDPAVEQRLASVGRVLPTVEVEIRGDDGNPLEAGEVGIVHVRGEQIAGEYSSGTLLDADGWFCTRDLGWLDGDGYLFIEGRADDTIIRGGENIAPAEIEDVLLRHRDVVEACVVGLPDDEWGERIVAVIVARVGTAPDPAELIDMVRASLRGTKCPDEIVLRSELPYTDTGKMLRRVVATEIATGKGTS